MTRALPFIQAFVGRAIKAARKQGLRVFGMTAKPDGAITIRAGEQQNAPDAAMSARAS
jgi:hypothetical protein